MTLTDAGPLVALIDAGERSHDACRRALAGLRLPLMTTWPAFAEAMYLLRHGGAPAQQALWSLFLKGRLVLADLSESATRRSCELMAKYTDVPMALADATLVALAEERNERRIFTLDADFGIYRLHGRHAFEVLPS